MKLVGNIFVITAGTYIISGNDYIYTYKKINLMRREHSIKWILYRTEELLSKALEFGDGSFVLYAALECRNMLEMLDFHLLWTGNDEPVQNGLIDLAEGKKGIPNANKHYKTLNYKYQEFWAAFADIIAFSGGLNRYNYKISAKLQEELGKYMHSYTKLTEDFVVNSSYMEKGKNLIIETVSFVKDFCLLKDHNGQDAIMYGGIKISSFPDDIRELYERWRNSPETGEEAELQLRDELSALLEHEPPINWNEVFKKTNLP